MTATANLDVVLRNEYDKMHKAENPKRAVQVDVTPLTAPDAHTWLNTHEKEIAKMRDIFCRKSNQPGPPQIVSYVDARFSQVTAIPQLEVKNCPQKDRRNGIVVARQLSKAKRLKDKGIKSKQGEEQSTGSKMCDDITNLLLSVGIHDDRDLEEVTKKQRVQRAKTRAKLKSRAVSAFRTGSPVMKAKESLVVKLRNSARGSKEGSPRPERDDAASTAEEKGEAEEKKEGDAKDNKEASTEGPDEKILHAEKWTDPNKKEAEEEKVVARRAGKQVATTAAERRAAKEERKAAKVARREEKVAAREAGLSAAGAGGATKAIKKKRRPRE